MSQSCTIKKNGMNVLYFCRNSNLGRHFNPPYTACIDETITKNTLWKPFDIGWIDEALADMEREISNCKSFIVKRQEDIAFLTNCKNAELTEIMERREEFLDDIKNAGEELEEDIIIQGKLCLLKEVLEEPLYDEEGNKMPPILTYCNY